MGHYFCSRVGGTLRFKIVRRAIKALRVMSVKRVGGDFTRRVR